MNKKAIIITCLIVILTMSLVLVIVNRLAPTTVLYVDPPSVRGTIGQNFAINVCVSNVADLYGWRIILRWNATILDMVDITEGSFLKSGGETFFPPPLVDSAAGYFILDCSLTGDISGVSGNGILVTIQFHVKEAGACLLDLYETTLFNSAETSQSIAHVVNDGSFTT